MKGRKITLFRLSCLVLTTLSFIFLIGGFNIFLLLFSVLCALIFGRLWCGYVCPLGFYQEILSLLRKNLRLPTIRLPQKVKPFLRPVKYAILIYFLAGMVFFSFRPVMYIRPDLAIGDSGLSIWKITLFGFFTGICFFNERAFCKYCPLGTLRGFVNKISFGRIKKKGTACTHCRACLESCPMDIKSIYEEREKPDVTHSDCIYCMKCIEACPEPDALSFSLFGKTILKSKRNLK